MKVPIFIDTDLDFDDYIAILYALANDNLDIKGISITGCGAVYREKGIRYITKLLEITGRTDIPIFLGAHTPLLYSNVFPYPIRRDANIAYGVYELLENPREYAVVGYAVDGIKNVLEQSQTKVNLVLLGGSSTIGRYIQSGYSLENVESILYSGGNILAEYLPASYAMYGSAGNVYSAFGNQNPVYSNKVAEYNVFIDAYATQLIIDSKVKTLFATLSSTSKGLRVCEDLAKKTESLGTIYAGLISRILEYVLQVPETPPIFDLNAIMLLACPELVTKFIKADACVELEFFPDDSDQLGKIIIQNINNENSQLDFFLDLDKDLLEEKFFDSLKNL